MRKYSQSTYDIALHVHVFRILQNFNRGKSKARWNRIFLSRPWKKRRLYGFFATKEGAKRFLTENSLTGTCNGWNSLYYKLESSLGPAVSQAYRFSIESIDRFTCLSDSTTSLSQVRPSESKLGQIQIEFPFCFVASLDFDGFPSQIQSFAYFPLDASPFNLRLVLLTIFVSNKTFVICINR